MFRWQGAHDPRRQDITAFEQTCLEAADPMVFLDAIMAAECPHDNTGGDCPCQNGATCYEHPGGWQCDCVEVTNPRTGEREAYDGEFCEDPVDVCAYEEDDCDPNYAACHHLGPGIHDCTCHIGWSGDGHTCSDIDECASSPCENGGACAESACEDSVFSDGGSVCEPSVSINAYKCACVAGFANGVCEYDFISEYDNECTVAESTASSALNGNCDIDVDECASSPCQNG
eukprot:COSAG04_NODE_6287_length_1365_cov_1.251185_1_plen_229_part_10